MLREPASLSPDSASCGNKNTGKSRMHGFLGFRHRTYAEQARLALKSHELGRFEGLRRTGSVSLLRARTVHEWLTCSFSVKKVLRRSGNAFWRRTRKGRLCKLLL